MSYQVTIRKNETGEVVISTQKFEWGEGSLFWWTDGNMGCDCNRELEFLRAKGASEEDIDASFDSDACGFERYSVPYAILADGTKVEVDKEGV